MTNPCAKSVPQPASRPSAEDIKTVELWFKSDEAGALLAQAAKKANEEIKRSRAHSRLSWTDLNTPICRI